MHLSHLARCKIRAVVGGMARGRSARTGPTGDMKSAEELAKGPLPFPGGSPVSLPRWSGVKVHPAPRPPEALSLDDAVANGEEYLIIRSPGSQASLQPTVRLLSHKVRDDPCSNPC